MKQRIISSMIGLLLLAFVLVFYNTYLFNVVIAVLVSIAVHEVLSAVKLNKNVPVAMASFLFSISIPLMAVEGMKDYYFVNTFLYVAALFIISIAQYKTTKCEQLGFVFFTTFVISFALTCAVLIRNVYKEDSLFYILLALGGAWITDSGAYFTGRFFGKHKLAPNISPKKTIEGAVGGVIVCILGFLLMGYINKSIYAYLGYSITISYLNLAIVALLCSLGGILGDLAASLIKRQTEIKDFGYIMPGHGGVLDRFDSVLFVAPLLFILLRIFPVVII